MTKKTARISLVAGNIRASGSPGLTEKQAKHDIEAALEQGRKLGAVVFLTEMVGKWRTIASTVGPMHGYPKRNRFSAGNETFLWRKDLRTGAKVKHLLTKGVAHVMMPGYAAALRTYPLGTTDFPVTYFGTHVAPGWFYRINSKDPKKRNDVRVRLFKAQRAKISAFVAGKLTSGVAAIMPLDQNSPVPVEWANHDQHLLGDIDGVMAIYLFTPKGWSYKYVAGGKITDVFTDHPIIWRTIDLTRDLAVKPKPASVKPPAKPAPVVHLPPSPPFIQARWFGGKQTPKTIVMHATVSPCEKGGARNIARFFAQRPATGKTSAHYTVDPTEVIQSVGDHSVAYHCGYNQDSIGIELCDPQAGPGSRWADANHKAMLARAATLVAELCLAYKIPAVRVTPSALTAGKHGICGHADMSKAFRRSTHTDPGPDFPWTEFIHQVKAEITRLEK